MAIGGSIGFWSAWGFRRFNNNCRFWPACGSRQQTGAHNAARVYTGSMEHTGSGSDMDERARIPYAVERVAGGIVRASCLLCAVLVLALSTSCLLFTDTSEYKLPAPDMRLDPAAISLTYSIYYCGDWRPGLSPLDEWILVDIFFHRVTGKEKAIVKLHGGRILHVFNAPVLRAWMPTASIPAVAAATDGAFMFFSQVQNPRRYDVPVVLGYPRTGPECYEHMEQMFAAHGGRITAHHEYDQVSDLLGWLPDHMITSLKRQADVSYVDYESIHCSD